ncbi:MAG: hypothetical protein KDE53_30325, partial [Caldilineaceae bacterium]|nr:hypothetical protein [Caldilineaceae bacterium]
QPEVRRYPVGRWMVMGLLVILFITGIYNSLAAQWEQAVNFGVGRGVQLVDPDGMNRMPVWPLQGESTVNFTLYPLTPADFARRMATY